MTEECVKQWPTIVPHFCLEASFQVHTVSGVSHRLRVVCSTWLRHHSSHLPVSGVPYRRWPYHFSLEASFQFQTRASLSYRLPGDLCPQHLVASPFLASTNMCGICLRSLR